MSDASDGRVGEVLARLALVTDPELDEPVTELGFITEVRVLAGGQVEIGFRLPTYWCAANFAFLMADDMQREVAALPWVQGVGVTLGEHMYAETINRAMAGGLSFQQAFAEAADGDLDAVRRVFAVKAFQRRQMLLLDHLLARGHDAEALMALDIAGLSALTLDADGARMRMHYLARRDIAGPAPPEAPAFVDAQGLPVPPAALPDHRRALRRVAVNVEFNGALCRGLLAARFDDVPGLDQVAEPTLLDFVRGRVPEGSRARA